MLKAIYINGKKIPVPVPVKTLDQALDWAHDTLVPDGHSITRISIDGVLLDEYGPTEINFEQPLDVTSKLELQVDSPVDLAVQTLEAIRNLGSVVNTGVKQLAVECWKAKPVDRPNELDETVHDLELVLELLDHLSGIVALEQVETAALGGLSGLIKRSTMGLVMAQSNSDWKACARILLNKLEPVIKDMMLEAENLQIRIMSTNKVSQHTLLAKAENQ